MYGINVMSTCPRVTELNATRLEKMAFWLYRAQARLVCLAVVSSGIQDHHILHISFSFYLVFYNSSSISPSSSPFIVND